MSTPHAPRQTAPPQRCADAIPTTEPPTQASPGPPLPPSRPRAGRLRSRAGALAGALAVAVAMAGAALVTASPATAAPRVPGRLLSAKAEPGVLAWADLATPRGTGAAVLANAPVVRLVAAADGTARIDQVISNLRNWIVGILAALATLFLTIGGLRYLLAGGDPGEVERAKSALRSAAIGYALAVLAPAIVEILKQVVGA